MTVPQHSNKTSIPNTTTTTVPTDKTTSTGATVSTSSFAKHTSPSPSHTSPSSAPPVDWNIRPTAWREAHVHRKQLAKYLSFAGLTAVISLVQASVLYSFNVSLLTFSTEGMPLDTGSVVSTWERVWFLAHTSTFRMLLAYSALDLAARAAQVLLDESRRFLKVLFATSVRSQALSYIFNVAEAETLDDEFRKEVVDRLSHAQWSLANCIMHSLEFTKLAMHLLVKLVTLAVAVSPTAAAVALIANAAFVFFIERHSQHLRAEDKASHDFARKSDAKVREVMTGFMDVMAHAWEFPSLKLAVMSEHEDKQLRFTRVITKWRHRRSLIVSAVQVTRLLIMVLMFLLTDDMSTLSATFLTLFSSLRGISDGVQRMNDLTADLKRQTAQWDSFGERMIALRPRTLYPQVVLPPGATLNISITNLHRTLSAPGRTDFHLRPSRPDQALSLCHGDTLQLLGSTGHGKSTLMEILVGCDRSTANHCRVTVNGEEVMGGMHALHSHRVYARQDCDRFVSFQGSILDVMAPWASLEQQQQEESSGSSSSGTMGGRRQDVWRLLDVVRLGEWVRRDLKGDIESPLKGHLSGGQKMRLALARILYRATVKATTETSRRGSTLLILDEVDKGLPNDLVVDIMRDVIEYWKPYGSLVLTVHTILPGSMYGHAKGITGAWRLEEGRVSVVGMSEVPTCDG